MTKHGSIHKNEVFEHFQYSNTPLILKQNIKQNSKHLLI